MQLVFSKYLPTDFKRRRMIVTSKSYRRYLYKSLQSLHDDLFETIKDWVERSSTVWDVGANCGVFSFASAISTGLSGRVFAFEADVNSIALMDRSKKYRLADEAEVVLFPIAICDRDGTVSFEVSNYRTAASSIGGFGRFNAGGKTVEVPAFKLDSLRRSLPGPQVLKIDVEGAEHLVLRGARGILSEDKPVVICECTGGLIGEEINTILQSAEYAWRPMNAHKNVPFTQSQIHCSDIVALPLSDPRCRLV